MALLEFLFGARKVELLRVFIVIDVLFSRLDRVIAFEEVTRVRQLELDDLIRLEDHLDFRAGF